MRGISKKMFISILTSVIVMVTMVATTFAWVGIFTYANTDIFQINLKTQDLDSNYYLTISSSGKKESFSDEVNIVDIQKSVLLNQYINESNYNTYKQYLDSLSSDAVKSLFAKNSILYPSTTLIEDNKLTEFQCINLLNTDYFEYVHRDNAYMKFDLYLSVGAKEGIQDTSNFDLNVFMTDLENTIVGTISEYKLYNRNPFVGLPSANEILLKIPYEKAFKINSKNAARFALSFYNPIGINDEYINSDSPNQTIIYHGGNQDPSLGNDIFDLGGNLPEDSNTALKELLTIRPNYKDGTYVNYVQDYKDALQKAIDRGNDDLDISEENSKIWNHVQTMSNEIDDQGRFICNYLGVKQGIQSKMKVSVYFWFEGWDSDCLSGIQDMPATLNLTFTAGTEE